MFRCYNWLSLVGWQIIVTINLLIIGLTPICNPFFCLYLPPKHKCVDICAYQMLFFPSHSQSYSTICPCTCTLWQMQVPPVVHVALESLDESIYCALLNLPPPPHCEWHSFSIKEWHISFVALMRAHQHKEWNDKRRPEYWDFWVLLKKLLKCFKRPFND